MPFLFIPCTFGFTLLRVHRGATFANIRPSVSPPSFFLQPYPNSISVGFEVFGKKFLFNNMQLMHDIVGENSTITYSHGDGDDEVKEVVPHTLQSYYQRDNKGNWITVTMYAPASHPRKSHFTSLHPT
jgi:hypothetical protein